MDRNKKKEYDVLVLTASTVDMIIEMEGTFPINGGCTRCVKSSHPEPGGEGNLMIVCSRMGGKVLPVGPLGNDYYGSYLISAYQKEGIDTSQLRTVENYRTPVANCIIDEEGIHTFVSTIGSCVFAGDEEILELLGQCKGLYLNGYNLANADQPFCPVSLKLLREAVRLNREIFFDTGPLCHEIDSEILDEVLQNSSVIALNDEEARMLTGYEDPELSADVLSKRTKGLVIVKAGGRGCYAMSSQSVGRWYPGFSVPVVDTMGAGDSFLGALIYAWQNGWEIDSCIVFANAAGAVKASKLGTGTQVPTFSEMVAILENNGYNFPVTGKKDTDKQVRS